MALLNGPGEVTVVQRLLAQANHDDKPGDVRVTQDKRLGHSVRSGIGGTALQDRAEQLGGGLVGRSLEVGVASE